MTNKTAEEHYWEIHKEIQALHQKKGADYGTSDDPFANLRAAEAFGIPNYIGVLIRMEDKMRRLRTFAQKGQLANESVEDAFLDLANYAMLGLALYREQHAQSPPSACALRGPVVIPQLHNTTEDHQVSRITERGQTDARSAADVPAAPSETPPGTLVQPNPIPLPCRLEGQLSAIVALTRKT